MPYEIQFLIVAVIFTCLGWTWGLQTKAKRTVEMVINNLIDDGFIKTKLDENGDTEMLRYWETEP